MILIIYLHTVHWFQVFLSNTNNFIKYRSFVCTQISGFKYSNLTLIVLFQHHHHHDVRPVRISLTLSLHVSLSFIASGRSSGLHPVSSHSCCMYVQAGRPLFDRPYAGYWGCRIHRLHLCSGVWLPPTNVLVITLNHTMVRLQLWKLGGGGGVPLHYHCFQVQPEW